MIGFKPIIGEESGSMDNAVNTPSTTPTETQEPNLVAPLKNIDISKSAVTMINDQAFTKHEQQLVALLEAAAEKSLEYPGFFLVISKGTSAAWLSKIYAEKTLNTPDAFVVISPFWPDRKHNQRLPDWIANTPMPVLDLYSGWDNGWAQMTVSQRQIAAIKSLKLQYRQRELLGFNTSLHQSNYISKEIYGWISHMGW